MKGEKPHQLIYLICTKIDQSESLLVVVYGEIITLACALSDDAADLRPACTCGRLPGGGGEYLNS